MRSSRSISSRSVHEMMTLRSSPVRNQLERSDSRQSTTVFNSVKSQAECVATAISRSPRSRSQSMNEYARSDTERADSRRSGSKNMSCSSFSRRQSTQGKSSRISDAGRRRSQMLTPEVSWQPGWPIHLTRLRRLWKPMAAVSMARRSGDATTSSMPGSICTVVRRPRAWARPTAVSGLSSISGRVYGLSSVSWPVLSTVRPKSR
mmetsp:Transcript_8067/g.24116  ORF Transcript_8067/g.24116 Transcript_8067/m.24116 type:complete len:205 (-) Transcript_8067:393-1007(-)